PQPNHRTVDELKCKPGGPKVLVPIAGNPLEQVLLELLGFGNALGNHPHTRARNCYGVTDAALFPEVGLAAAPAAPKKRRPDRLVVFREHLAACLGLKPSS